MRRHNSNAYVVIGLDARTIRFQRWLERIYQRTVLIPLRSNSLTFQAKKSGNVISFLTVIVVQLSFLNHLQHRSNGGIFVFFFFVYVPSYQPIVHTFAGDPSLFRLRPSSICGQRRGTSAVGSGGWRVRNRDAIVVSDHQARAGRPYRRVPLEEV